MYKKRGRKSKLPNKEMFEAMYYNDSISASEIADFYKVNVQTIYNWANKFRKEELLDKQIFHSLNNNTKKRKGVS